MAALIKCALLTLCLAMLALPVAQAVDCNVAFCASCSVTNVCARCQSGSYEIFQDGVRFCRSCADHCTACADGGYCTSCTGDFVATGGVCTKTIVIPSGASNIAVTASAAAAVVALLATLLA
ncbi:hypothetical protein, conserved [Angomonas deanei]|uniref:Surface antigen-like protein n=1 Tax=Angomonas deanei TaxID=59799 RepID=A0A7G2CGK3_9TRYP|nr:hypothetical protein, conserved [Angomonas deanei]